VSTERGRRDWSRGLPPAITPGGPSEFEHLVATLGLSPEQYEGSPVLKEWVRKNKNDKYVPTELLRVWRFKVEPEA
jgi:hypothetical protein